MRRDTPCGTICTAKAWVKGVYACLQGVSVNVDVEKFCWRSDAYSLDDDVYAKVCGSPRREPTATSPESGPWDG